MFHAQFSLEHLHVLCLKALGAFHDVELYPLTFLQATETVAADGREMHENVFASLTADEAEALGVVKPFHCSLFHCLFLIVVKFLLRRIAATERGDAETRNQLSTAWSQTMTDTI